MKKFKLILEELNRLHIDVSIRRAYGNFSTRHTCKALATALRDNSIVTVQADSYVTGKSTTDSALMIDAMDLLYCDTELDGFVLITSDSDFCGLILRLRKAGKHVIVVAYKESPSLLKSSDHFIRSDTLGVKP